jgi:hypothetical protein
MVIWTDITIPVQVLVLRLPSFEKSVVIIHTFIPDMLQTEFKPLTEDTLKFSGYGLIKRVCET